jgi:hypothetical protein
MCIDRREVLNIPDYRYEREIFQGKMKGVLERCLYGKE